jgi:hypothetical protein
MGIEYEFEYTPIHESLSVMARERPTVDLKID